MTQPITLGNGRSGGGKGNHRQLEVISEVNVEVNQNFNGLFATLKVKSRAGYFRVSSEGLYRVYFAAVKEPG